MHWSICNVINITDEKSKWYQVTIWILKQTWKISVNQIQFTSYNHIKNKWNSKTIITHAHISWDILYFSQIIDGFNSDVIWAEFIVLSFVMIDACGVPNPDLSVTVTDIMDLYGREMGWKHTHDHVISWECFLHYWPFLRGIHHGFHSQKGPVMLTLMSLCFEPDQAVEQTVELPVIWDDMTSINAAVIGGIWSLRFLCFQPDQAVKQTVELHVSWDAMLLMWGHCYKCGSYRLNRSMWQWNIDRLFWGNIENIVAFSIISWHWDGTRNWNIFSWNAMTFFLHISIATKDMNQVNSSFGIDLVISE